MQKIFQAKNQAIERAREEESSGNGVKWRDFGLTKCGYYA